MFFCTLLRAQKWRVSNMAKKNKEFVKRGIQGLREGAEVLAKRGWTQGAYARDEHGFMTGSNNRDAVAYCMLGAAVKATGSQVPTDSLCIDVTGHTAPHINDYECKDKEHAIMTMLLIAEIAENGDY